MREILEQRLSSAASLPDITRVALPFLRDFSYERGGLYYVSGRWDPPWVTPDSAFNSRLEKNARRVEYHTGTPAIYDGDIFNKGLCERIIDNQQIPNSDDLIEFRRRLLVRGGVTGVIVMPGWMRFTETLAAVGSVPEHIGVVYAEVDDRLFLPMPQELEEL